MNDSTIRVGFRRGNQYAVFTIDLNEGKVYLHLEIGEDAGDFEFSLSD